MGRMGLQREPDNFFRETEDEAFSIRRVTKGAFSQSRRKLAPEAFLELIEIIWRDFYKEVDYLGYHGHKLLAVDGSFRNLPDHTSIREEFGTRGMGRGRRRGNYLTLDVQPIIWMPVNTLETSKALLYELQGRLALKLIIT